MIRHKLRSSVAEIKPKELRHVEPIAYKFESAIRISRSDMGAAVALLDGNAVQACKLFVALVQFTGRFIAENVEQTRNKPLVMALAQAHIFAHNPQVQAAAAGVPPKNASAMLARIIESAAKLISTSNGAISPTGV